MISNELGFLELSPGLSAPSSSEIQRLSPAAFAYLGDAVYELYIRRQFLLPPKRSEDYHRQVVSHVKAESQAAHLRSLMPHLSEAEHEFVKRGRNAALNRPKRLEPEIYQLATSLEALIGYLYLTNPDRLSELLGFLDLQ
ncbi:ribonuclease III [Leptolyngbya boryana NIES-2135]|uniref:Mini-ribonuclease 3 n=1 Tax=Leptolyngbya boryana NIES-2135 TaxID=1973484 RepID=A0A1Z4JMY1_LEPBY|nr:ribonuclease III [Leptolyngbya boryana IAM M-101]BAS62085.1 ribonuclease III [Leptolyngbya boryana dg5]BAY58102.1 ribonuclease III [Leptolyngbya boryana NIES-2135]